MPVTDEEQA